MRRVWVLVLVVLCWPVLATGQTIGANQCCKCVAGARGQGRTISVSAFNALIELAVKAVKP